MLNRDKIFKKIGIVMVMILLTACGSSNGDSKISTPSTQPTVEPSPSPKVEENITKTKGYLIDSPIEGVNYFCAEGTEGLTNEEGMFECEKAPVTFKVGALTLGILNTFTSDKKVYLQDLISGVERGTYKNSKLKLFARFIQSLDDDGDINKKITITPKVRDSFRVEQNLSEMSEDDVESLIKGAGKNFVPECGAVKHLGDKSIDCNGVGEYVVNHEYVDSIPTPTPDSIKPMVTLNGEANVSLFINQAYVEENATATDNRDGNLTSSIVVIGSVDVASVGTYRLTYRVKDGAGNEGNATRTVNIIDNISPTITLNGDENVSVYINQAYSELNATATDNVDGNVTSSIVITGSVDIATVGTYRLTYRVKDRAGNEGNATRTVNIIDNISPVITLNGDENVSVYINQTYSELNATAIDNVDGNITTNIVIGGSVDTTVIGVYTLTYTIRDSAGNESNVTRTVNILNHVPVATAQTITLNEDTSKAITLIATDADGDSLIYTVLSQPTHGTLSGTAPSLTYIPTANYFGSDSLTFKVNDGRVDSATVEVNLTINSVNDAPVLQKDNLTVSFDEHSISIKAQPNAIYGTDLDKDGDKDFLVALENQPLIWYENDGNQNFTEHNISTFFMESWSVKAVDIDLDSDMDILLATGSNALVWYENDGSQNFLEHNISLNEGRSWWIDSGDVDKDGDLDIFSSDRNGKVKWWENDGSQNFVENNLSNGGDWAYLTMSDLDKDGSNDFIAVKNNENSIVWYQNDGTENFVEHNVTTTLYHGFSVYITDIDNDGDKDIVGTGWEMTVLYENDGSQNFTEHNISLGEEYVGTSVADIDDDGDMDIVNSRVWFENIGDLNFKKHELSQFSPYFDAIDLDGDGDLDILSPYYGSSVIAWQENLGLTTIYAQDNNTTVGTMVATDVDGDTLTYSISGTDADKFDINASTGELTFKVAPDHENPIDDDEDNVYEFSVAVTDDSDSDELEIRVIVEKEDEPEGAGE